MPTPRMIRPGSPSRPPGMPPKASKQNCWRPGARWFVWSGGYGPGWGAGWERWIRTGYYKFVLIDKGRLDR